MNINDYKQFTTDSVIYGIKNINTNKWYIGSCINFKNRLTRHRYYLINGIHHSKKLQNSFDKHGIDSFDICILKNISSLTNTQRLKLEEKFIKKYKGFSNGYNMTDVCLNYNSFKQTNESLKNFKLSRSIPVMAFDRISGNFENEFTSVSDAAKYYNTQSSNISKVCKGMINFIKGKVFIYKSDYDCNTSYKRNFRAKDRKFSNKHKHKLSKSNRKNKIVCKYDLQNNLIEEYYCKLEAERKNNLPKDKLRLDRKEYFIIDNYLYKYKNKDIV